MARVFSAIDIENEEVLEELKYVRDTIDLGFNKLTTDKMHITLEFFKDLDQNEINRYKRKLRETDIGSFKVDMEGVSSFPSHDHIRVVWAGLEDEKKVRNLHKIVSQHQLNSDNKHRFKPHTTLFRVNKMTKSKKKRLKNNIREFQDYKFGEIKINKIKLFESRMEGQNSKYKVLEEFEL